ncbi:MAG: Rossmann-like and DUF2520 domain-containing protein [Myxococcota bacterium]
MQHEPRDWVLGAGRLGIQLGWSLHHQQGLPVSIWHRTPLSAEKESWLAGIEHVVGPLPLNALVRARMVLLTVSDSAIGELAQKLADTLPQPPENPPHFFHCSGALSVEALAPLALKGYPTGGFHPLQSFSGAPSPTKFVGTFFALEGHLDAVAHGQALAHALGGFTGTLRPGKRLYYHAAAVLASNLLVALEALAVEVMAEATGPELDAAQRLKMLLPLVEGTVANLRSQGIPAALTGPVSRGDVQVVAQQWQALQKLEDAANQTSLSSASERLDSAQAPAQRSVSEVYRLLSREAVTLARARGIPAEQADSLDLALGKPVKSFDKAHPGVINEE